MDKKTTSDPRAETPADHSLESPKPTMAKTDQSVPTGQSPSSQKHHESEDSPRHREEKTDKGETGAKENQNIPEKVPDAPETPSLGPAQPESIVQQNSPSQQDSRSEEKAAKVVDAPNTTATELAQPAPTVQVIPAQKDTKTEETTTESRKVSSNSSKTLSATHSPRSPKTPPVKPVRRMSTTQKPLSREEFSRERNSARIAESERTNTAKKLSWQTAIDLCNLYASCVTPADDNGIMTQAEERWKLVSNHIRNYASAQQSLFSVIDIYTLEVKVYEKEGITKEAHWVLRHTDDDDFLISGCTIQLRDAAFNDGKGVRLATMALIKNLWTHKDYRMSGMAKRLL